MYFSNHLQMYGDLIKAHVKMLGGFIRTHLGRLVASEIRNMLRRFTKSNLYLCCCIDDLITPHYWSYSVLIILTNQIVTFTHLKVFLKLDLLIWVDYMLEVSWKRNFHRLQKYCTAFKLSYLISQNHDTICKLQSSYKVHMKRISKGE